MIEGANQSVYHYPVYLRAASPVDTVVLWTSVQSLRGVWVNSVPELHALEIAAGAPPRGVPVG